jgi:hypothetical protein
MTIDTIFHESTDLSAKTIAFDVLSSSRRIRWSSDWSSG